MGDIDYKLTCNWGSDLVATVPASELAFDGLCQVLPLSRSHQ